MHFEILVEDQSGKRMLDILIPKIIGNQHSFKVHAYQGIGCIPRKLTSGTSVRNRLLLDQLPRLLRGYGNTFANYSANYPTAVILVCDLILLSPRCCKKGKCCMNAVRPEQAWFEKADQDLEMARRALEDKDPENPKIL